MSLDGPPNPGSKVADFQVDWPHPEDSAYTWVWDPVHCPHPLTPLSTDFATRVLRAIARSLGLRPGEGMRTVFPNGYAYFLEQPAALRVQSASNITGLDPLLRPGNPHLRCDLD